MPANIEIKARTEKSDELLDRLLYIVGQTRVHLDNVSGLGSFVELEVVLRTGQSDAEGQMVARDLMAMLDICEEDLVDCAYIDLLTQNDIN
jgi:adenylate cyclase class IV